MRAATILSSFRGSPRAVSRASNKKDGRTMSSNPASRIRTRMLAQLTERAAAIRTLDKRTIENVVEIGKHLIASKELAGHPDVVDADLADYFGSIPHAELLKSVSRRIVDRRVLHLIKMWLDCPVEETDDRGRRTRTIEARDKRRGIPQGSPLSPLWPMFTCGGSCWDGRCSGLSEASALAS
jgi:reverse transcriptase-like protein